jgi:hypothetical protein
MTHREAREFIRKHFEEFVNKKNVQVGNLNFAADFVDHGADVPPGMPPGPAGAIAYVSGALQKFPDLYARSIQNAKKDGYLKLAATTVKRAESQS